MKQSVIQNNGLEAEQYDMYRRLCADPGNESAFRESRAYEYPRASGLWNTGERRNAVMP